jgi:hypothetical protein
MGDRTEMARLRVRSLLVGAWAVSFTGLYLIILGLSWALFR